MQVAKDLPAKLIDEVIKSKEKGETTQNSMVNLISKTIKILANPTRKKIFLECLNSSKEFDRNPIMLYHLRTLEDFGIIRYTSRGYTPTNFAIELWNSINELAIIPNSTLSIKILLSLKSKPKTFTELKKNLKVNEGSIFRILNFLSSNKLIIKEANYYNLTSLANLSKLDNLVSRYAELIKDASYDDNLESITIPKEEEIEILDLFESKEKERIKKKLWRMEDLIRDNIIMSCSYSSHVETDKIINYILEEFCGSTNFKRIKIIHPYEKNMIKLGYEAKYITSLQKLLNLFHLHGWRAFDSLLIEDISFPKKIIKNFKGPKFGRDGIRKLLNVNDRPLLQAGFLPEENFDIQTVKSLSKKLFVTGVDEISESYAVLDNLQNFRRRVEIIAQIIDEIRNDYGQKIYYFYIYGEDYEDRLNILKEANSKGIGITFSPITIGFPLASYIINKYKYPAQIHLTLLAPFVKYAKRRISKEGELLPGFGASINVMLKLFVLLGADEIPFESPFRHYYEWWETKIQCDILNSYFEELKKPFPVLFSEMNPANAQISIKNLGSDIILKLRAWDLIKAEKLGFSIERSINAFKQAIEIAISEEKEITAEKYKDYIDSFKFYKKHENF